MTPFYPRLGELTFAPPTQKSLPMMHCCLGFQGKASEGSRAACLSGVKLTDWIGTGKRGRKKRGETRKNKRRDVLGLAVQTLKFPRTTSIRSSEKGCQKDIGRIDLPKK